MKNIKQGDLVFFTQHTRQFAAIIVKPPVINSTSVLFYYMDEVNNFINYTYCYDNRPEQSVKLLDNPELKAKLEAKLDLYNRTQGFKNLGKTNEMIGSDPEIFVVGADDKVIPSYEFLKSAKEKDLTLPPHNNIIGGTNAKQETIFWDGFQGEFNVTANGCLAWTVDSTFLGLKTMLQKAQAYNKDARLTIKSTLDIDSEVLRTAKKEHVEFGCMPSLNIYNMKGITLDGRDVPFRSAGGHIHFGLSDRHRSKEQIERYVKALDAILGVACVSLFAKYDDPRRREMYGLAGEYRLPPHGLEYRTLSSAWLSHPLIMNMVFELSRRALSVGENNLLKYWDSTEEETVQCINNCDVDLAREILARNKEQFLSILESHCGDKELALNLYKIYMLGIDSILETPDDLTKNWGLDGTFAGHCNGYGMQVCTINQQPKYELLANEKVTEIYEELVAEIKNTEVVTALPRKRA